MRLDTNQTVREIAIHNPATVRVFESLGIDYCCGGKRPLSEACDRAQVPLERAVAMLSAVEDAPASSDEKEWTSRPMRELIEHIVTRHHSFVREESARIEPLLAKVVSKHGTGHAELAAVQDLFGALAEELAAHMMKEERILFPFLENMEAMGAIPAGCFGSVEFPIARMLADHDDAGELVAKIRTLTGQYQPPEDACPSYRGLYHALGEFERDLHQHIHLENNILFPRATEMEKHLLESERGNRSFA